MPVEPSPREMGKMEQTGCMRLKKEKNILTQITHLLEAQPVLAIAVLPFMYQLISRLLSCLCFQQLFENGKYRQYFTNKKD